MDRGWEAEMGKKKKERKRRGGKEVPLLIFQNVAAPRSEH